MAQAALIQDTIAGMKRAVQGSYSSESDSFVPISTNRGQKLKRKAHYTQEGRLNSGKKQKRKIEHAGYHRFILKRNPKRYDDYGDELEEDEEDELADIVAMESNPYGDIKLEQILAPLTSAAELPDHPSMSIPYRPQVLGELVRQAREMVHKERQTLWGVKHLATKFRGDHPWITSETLYLADDASLFATDKNLHSDDLSTSNIPRQLRSTFPQSEIIDLGNSDSLTGGQTSKRPDYAAQPSNSSHNTDITRQGSVLGVSTSIDVDVLTSITSESVLAPTKDSTADSASDGVSMSMPENHKLLREAKGQGFASMESDMPKSPETVMIERSNDSLLELDPQDDILKPSTSTQPSVNDAQGEDVQIPAHRMRTRAQAQALSDKAASTPTRSLSTEPTTLPDIHPLYITPPSAMPDRDFGLPPNEAEETRCIMMLWIQKQEEICRSAERLYVDLLKSDRMRKTVLSWCKAEGHSGEMSDGEDWYDKEEWGLEDELKKGQPEEDDDAANQGKKTRRRAQ